MRQHALNLEDMLPDGIELLYLREIEFMSVSAGFLSFFLFFHKTLPIEPRAFSTMVWEIKGFFEFAYRF